MGSCPRSLFPVNGPLGNQAGRSRSSCSQVSQQTNYLAITHAFGWSTHSLSWLWGAAPRLHPKSFTKVLALIYWLTICLSPTSITLLFQLTVFPLEPWHFFNYLRWGSSPNYLILDKKAGAVSVLFLTLYPSPGGSDGKESACNAGNPSSIAGLWRSAGEGNGNPLQYSCLENPMDTGAWLATVLGVAKSQPQLSDFTFFHFLHPTHLLGTSF